MAEDSTETPTLTESLKTCLKKITDDLEEVVFKIPGFRPEISLSVEVGSYSGRSEEFINNLLKFDGAEEKKDYLFTAKFYIEKGRRLLSLIEKVDLKPSEKALCSNYIKLSLLAIEEFYEKHEKELDDYIKKVEEEDLLNAAKNL